MAEEPRTEKNITDELNKLGQQVADAIKAAWASDDLKKLQAEISEGLQKFGDQVGDAVQKASESEATKQLREQAEKVAVEIKESDVAGEVRKGLLTGLDALNKQLSKLLEKLETKEEPEEAPAEVEPAESAE